MPTCCLCGVASHVFHSTSSDSSTNSAQIDADTFAPDNEGKLLTAADKLKGGALKDPKPGVKVKALKLERKAEIPRWTAPRQDARARRWRGTLPFE